MQCVHAVYKQSWQLQVIGSLIIENKLGRSAADR